MKKWKSPKVKKKGHTRVNGWRSGSEGKNHNCLPTERIERVKCVGKERKKY